MTEPLRQCLGRQPADSQYLDGSSSGSAVAVSANIVDAPDGRDPLQRLLTHDIPGSSIDRYGNRYVCYWA